jgi:hypothetical protein
MEINGFIDRNYTFFLFASLRFMLDWIYIKISNNLNKDIKIHHRKYKDNKNYIKKMQKIYWNIYNDNKNKKIKNTNIS